MSNRDAIIVNARRIITEAKRVRKTHPKASAETRRLAGDIIKRIARETAPDDTIQRYRVYRTPFEPSGLFLVTEIEPDTGIYGETAFGIYVFDHPTGNKSGSVGRYPCKELQGRMVPKKEIDTNGANPAE